MIFRAFFLPLLVVVSLLTGCATGPQPMPDELRTSMKRVAWHPENGFQARLLYSGPGKAWGLGLGAAVGGAIGSLIADSASSGLGKNEKRILDYLNANNIDINARAKAVTEKVLSKYFELVPADANPDKFIKMDWTFGFFSTSPLNRHVSPGMFWTLNFVDDKGEFVWKPPFPSPPVPQIKLEHPPRNLTHWLEIEPEEFNEYLDKLFAHMEKVLDAQFKTAFSTTPQQ